MNHYGSKKGKITITLKKKLKQTPFVSVRSVTPVRSVSGDAFNWMPVRSVTSVGATLLTGWEGTLLTGSQLKVSPLL